MKFLKKFDDALWEGVLYFDKVPFSEDDVDWKLILNLTPMWNQFLRGDVDQKTFNYHYGIFLEGQKKEFNQLGCWNKFVKLIEKLKVSSDSTLYEKIYDIADKYLIKINTEEIK